MKNKTRAEEKEKAAKQEAADAEKKAAAAVEKKVEEPVKTETTTVGPKVLGMVDLSTLNQKTKPDKKTKKENTAILF